MSVRLLPADMDTIVGRLTLEVLVVKVVATAAVTDADPKNKDDP